MGTRDIAGLILESASSPARAFPGIAREPPSDAEGTARDQPRPLPSGANANLGPTFQGQRDTG